MQLRNVQFIDGAGLKDLHIANGRIAAIVDAGFSNAGLSFAGAIAFPGLINSHDHLDFDVFQPMRSRLYSSYRDWGSDIHRQFAADIAKVLSIPRQLRSRWGVYKNLLCGVTSVVHHGAGVDIPEDLVSVFQDADNFHSVSGERGWRWKLLNPFRRGRPLAIHIGEGTTAACRAEIGELLRWNVFGRPLVGIHGIAMTEAQADAFAGLVWCPDSNYFLYGKTADIPLLRQRTRVIFGTDSTLTASWDFWRQLRIARETGMVEDAVLWDMVTAGPARLWGLEGYGELSDGAVADLVIAAPAAGATGWDRVFALDPADILLVMRHGKICVLDGSLCDGVSASAEAMDGVSASAFSMEGFYPVTVGGRLKYVAGNLPALMQEIHACDPSVSFPVVTETIP